MRRTVRTLCLISALLLGQFALSGQPLDSATVLQQAAFLSWVAEYHPVARQGRLLGVEAEALERLARGGFDPKLYGHWDEKAFKENDYFAFGEGGVKIPTWYGIELKGAYAWSQVDAIYQNPERTLPETGQAVLGIKVPLGRNLIIDERRAALAQAKIIAQANEAERQAMVNNLLIDAASAYWDWSVAYNQLIIFEQALELTRVRLAGIVESYEAGDLPAVDTLETLIQVQNRELDVADAKLVYRNATLMLSNYLWTEAGEPLEITEQLRPPLLEILPLPLLPGTRELLWEEARRLHPDIRRYEFKLQELDIDRRLAVEQLKPQLDVEYNLLGEDVNFLPGPAVDNGLGSLLGRNYKWGVRFEFPLLLRKERGKVELARIKVQDTEYQLQRKRLEIENKINNYYNEQETLQQQVALYTNAVANYRRLLDAEYRKFDIGESSIFLINSREQSLIDAQMKLTALRGKLFKARQKLEWATGRLGQ